MVRVCRPDSSASVSCVQPWTVRKVFTSQPISSGLRKRGSLVVVWAAWLVGTGRLLLLPSPCCGLARRNTTAARQHSDSRAAAQLGKVLDATSRTGGPVEA